MSNSICPTKEPFFYISRWYKHTQSIDKVDYFIIKQKCKDNRCMYCYYDINDMRTKVYMDYNNNLWIRLDTQYPKEYVFSLLISI